ncbi:hypothetical protein RvY_05270-2 [Ramazzottius varieornatus]|uniref:Uncharacterized protein n=1 Tax=Ramazzottius varieornatus TaxID=947166 RepID=A0A1D1V161_RAMVA|nr:hypothetical protein RvY_05270-2 [Ramazzottius varieornatus]
MVHTSRSLLDTDLCIGKGNQPWQTKRILALEHQVEVTAKLDPNKKLGRLKPPLADGAMGLKKLGKNKPDREQQHFMNKSKTFKVVTDNPALKNAPILENKVEDRKRRSSESVSSGNKKKSVAVDPKTPLTAEEALPNIKAPVAEEERSQSPTPTSASERHKTGRRSAEKKPESNNSSTCIASDCPKDPNLDEDFMIQCDECDEWFHGMCAFITEKQSNAYVWWFCTECIAKGQKPQKKPRTNNHRHDYYEPRPSKKPTQCGTERFFEELSTKNLAPIVDVLIRKPGREIDLDYMHNNGFTKPILIDDRAGLDLIIPERPFTYDDVVKTIGENTQVLAIDVTTQEDGVPLTLKSYLRYMMQPPEEREVTLNIISLEFSKTELSKLVQPPRVVKELSWVDRFFENEDILPEASYDRPDVQKYCLMSAKDSYTDFHIDFGGTSVWYHIFKGKKTFFFIEPTPENLALYKSWMEDETHQSERFLGDETTCHRLDLVEGQTILMPSGWIHAVFTPEDSLVFGGNFLHDLAVPNQLAIMDMEDQLQTPDRYRFPHFYTVCWFALSEMVGQLEDCFEQAKEPPAWLTQNIVPLYVRLKAWIEADGDLEKQKLRKAEIPDTLAEGKEILKKMDNFVKRLAKIKSVADAGKCTV